MISSLVRRIVILSSAFVVVATVLMPVYIYAVGDPQGGSNIGETGSPDILFEINNPLRADSLQCLLYYLVQGLTSIVGIVAALYIIYSGFMFVAARGNADKLKDARRAFLNAIIGTAILLGAWAITSLLVNVINSVLLRNNMPNLPTSAACR